MATTDRTRSFLDGEVSLQLPAPDMRIPAVDHRAAQAHLIACSRCLRVLRDEHWVRAETVIRELRTFEQAEPPRFEAVLCPLCTFSIHLRRSEARAAPHGGRAAA